LLKEIGPRSIEYLFKRSKTTSLWKRNLLRKKKNSFDLRYPLSFMTFYPYFEKRMLKDSLLTGAPLTALSTSRRANQLPLALFTLCQTLNYRPLGLIWMITFEKAILSLPLL
jgi:hypothetical protein